MNIPAFLDQILTAKPFSYSNDLALAEKQNFIEGSQSNHLVERSEPHGEDCLLIFLVSQNLLFTSRVAVRKNRLRF